MARIEKTVFISYRRKDISWALAVYQYLSSQKYDVFFDYTSIPSGDFEQIIVSNIRARAHFVLILTPTALDRCSEPGDWLRREIETAIEEKRNIIPLFFDGFNFGSPSVAEKLTGKLSTLRSYNGLDIPAGYFVEAMERLHRRYLNVPLEAVLHPVSTEVRKVVKEEQSAVNEALAQKWEDIKELIKSADEKSVEREQAQIEPISRSNSLSGSRVERKSRNINFRLFGITIGIILVAALGVIGFNALFPNKEEAPPTMTNQVINTVPIESSATSPVNQVPIETTAFVPTNTPEPIRTSTPTETAEPTRTSTPTDTSQPTPFGGAGEKIAYVVDNQIWTMNLDGSGPTQLTFPPEINVKPDWSPDGRRIAFISRRDGNSEIYVMNGDGSGQTRLTTDNLSESEPAWSPDGDRIAYSADGEIYVMQADGSNQIRLTSNADLDDNPDWSPDGNRIVFESNRDGEQISTAFGPFKPGEIYVMNADGGAQTRLTFEPSVVDFYPAWSPDGSHIAFVSQRDGHNEVYLMNPDGSGQIRLTHTSVDDADPAWSPDGTMIIYTSRTSGTDDIYIMRTDGTIVRRLTNNTIYDIWPSWQP